MEFLKTFSKTKIKKGIHGFWKL